MNQQWLSFHIAAMSSSLIGSLLVQKRHRPAPCMVPR